MKIAIITYHNSYNYGAALQAYATIEYLKALGYEPFLIDYYPENLKNFGTLKSVYKEAGYKTKNPIKRILLTIVRYPSHKKLAKRFNNFAYTTFPLSKTYIDNETLKKDVPEADIYCTGSDQVWNNYYTHQFDDTFFLDFAPNDKPKFALSSSFGKSDFNKDELSYIKEHVSKYNFITVRENTAKQILANMNIPSQVVPDPTILTSLKTWEDFAENPNIKKPYILVYQLHGNGTALTKAIDFGKKKNMQVVRINVFLHHFCFGCKNIIIPDPHIFLGLFKNADYVFTDSFHGTVFSLLFGKTLAVELPHKFNDRISTLLTEVGGENYILNNLDDWEKESTKADKNKIRIKLDKYREIGDQKLRSNIKSL